MISFMKKRLAQSESEGGFALALVLAISLVLILLIATVTSASVSNLTTTRTDQDGSAALAAAYAGVDEYESRLAQDSSYGQYGNPASAFTTATGSNVIMPAASSPNPAFGITKGGTWATVAGSNGLSQFRYEVDNSKFASNGILRIRSTGLAGGQTRSVIATVKGRGFIDFLYFTDYEITDPSLGPFNSSGNPTCTAAYGWQNATRPNCTELTFQNGDVLDGPVHSNDVMHICNASFTDTVTSADPTAPYYSATTGVTYPASGSVSHTACSGQTWATIGGASSVPTQDSTYVLPATNNNQLQDTVVNDPLNTPRPGCLYTGPTKITMLANGTMTVWSPYTKYTQAGAIQSPSAGVVLQNCGTPGPGGLGAVGGQNIPVPTNNIVYVQNVPASSSDPNYTAAGASPETAFQGCYGANTTTATSTYVLGDTRVAGNGIGYPTVKTTTTTSGSKTYTTNVNEQAPSSTSYGCTNGDAFVQGALSGRLTVAAQNYVYVTSNITYADPSGDIMGLVGQKAIFIYNPYLTNGTFLNPTGTFSIYAAMLSVADTVTVQNYTLGTAQRGTLYIKGAIAQKFRGAVGVSYGTYSTGYVKSYHYDPQMKTSAPPDFLAPVTTTYGTTSVAQVAAGFTADGTAVTSVN